MVEAAKVAGFDEIFSAVVRYRSAVTVNSEPLEIAVKPLTRAIYSLKFRPAVGSKDSDLLNAWVAFDLASRGVGDTETAFKALLEATNAANARQVKTALGWYVGVRLRTADPPTPADAAAADLAARAIALSVYEAAYHRPAPPPRESY
jgi:hypothetical protein